MGNRFTSCTICLDISISDGTGTLGCSSGYPNAFTVVIVVRMVNPGFNEWRMKRRYGAAGSRSIDTIFDINASSSNQLWNQSIVMLNVSLSCSNRRRTCVQWVGSLALCERASKKELRHRDVLIQTLLIKEHVLTGLEELILLSLSL